MFDVPSRRELASTRAGVWSSWDADALVRIHHIFDRPELPPLAGRQTIRQEDTLPIILPWDVKRPSRPVDNTMSLEGDYGRML